MKAVGRAADRPGSSAQPHHRKRRKRGRPFAFISWATVSEEVEARISKGQLRMGPQDWRSGEQAWIIDMVAPFGGGEQALKEIRERVFVGRKVKALQPAPDGVGLGVMEW